MNDSFSIRLARAEDLASMLEIERSSPTAAHWQELDYRNAIVQSGRVVLVAARDSVVVGFLVASVTTQEWELENIAVAPPARHRGVGQSLMQALIVLARQAKAVEIRQEIRASNTVAQRLGQSAGFVQNGLRRGYYRDPAEDALLFKYLIKNPEAP